ncbi:DNA-binding transcriptional ArsR family regulator [Bacillus mesophilus]|uniref:Helix-turn-helix domain-containing protein n=1 Tax=Bacillus mesophilus TaxID=1808955 RepID=A0A6M0QBE6_9BACI|nr:helix-turn-helix domain-containing protein [Bacillus mesophilus]MBM7663023.1 DNA-binding transcriptional ArsR family regulator [Bacillus mesophilus]NEY73655.1 helix-turn-helix domain-containing protein [Bacillus mesophilus]
MSESKADLLLHPIRMRILQSLINESLSAQQMREKLPEVPQATFYRHLKKLYESGTIFVTDEQPIRGTIEKVYSLSPNNSQINNGDLSEYTKDQHLELFMKYMANLLSEYEQYVSQGSFDFEKDGVSLRQATIFLSDEEFKDFLQEVSQAYAKVIKNQPSPNRKKRTFANIIIPGINQ